MKDKYGTLPNGTPHELRVIKTSLLLHGFVLSGSTFSHPSAPRYRVTMSYAHREGTLTVLRVKGRLKGNRRGAAWCPYVWYAGPRPLAWAREVFPKIFPKIFTRTPDSTSPES